ncbi:YkuS family protein [Lutispora saccharofermentans]|uniref:YkuS family protein n=1 Tax=Lutispora saccharofermentans TaxID=3024236 RepID=A0ABT1NKG0_9FIRM|nr:YkuS family protein [Lutispora saccharofermentans]MCQ1531667.1 YkuS family protein [Lutispora saccharofermentans]
MVIAVEKGLKSLKEQLESMGYECFYIGENRVADAIIYKDKDNQPYFEVNKSSITNALSSYGASAHGALLINAGNKSIDEIVNILTRRTYSPLL